MKPQNTILANRKKRLNGIKREVTPEHPATYKTSTKNMCKATNAIMEMSTPTAR